MFTRVTKSIFLNSIIWAISLSYGYVDWMLYREKFLVNPDGWRHYFSGGIEAPWQYRIGIWEVVDWMERFFHLRPYDTLALMDVLCVGFALWILLRSLRTSEIYSVAPPVARGAAIAVLFLLAQYYLGWGHWYQTGVTLPSVLYVSLSMALVNGEVTNSRSLAGLLLIFLSWVQGFIRADVAVILHAGFFLTVLLRPRRAVPLGRGLQAGISLLAVLVAGCVQLYLMLVRFPHAKYGPGGVVRIVTNLHPGMWLTLLLGMLPYWLMLAWMFRRHYHPDQVTTMLLTASFLYLAVWSVVGLLDEVRIFLPFAFALMPATALAVVGLLTETGTAT